MADGPENVSLLRMTYDFNVAFYLAENASTMVSKLKELPSRDIYAMYKGHGHVYDDVTWKRDVLPSVGGSTKSYQNKIMDATKAFLDLGEKYGLIRKLPLRNICAFSGERLQLMFDAWKMPEELRPWAKGLFDMIGGIARYHSTYLGNTHTWIQCEGEDCTKDNLSATFATGLGARLCFIENADGDGYCYGYNADPHVKEISLDCSEDD